MAWFSWNNKLTKRIVLSVSSLAVFGLSFWAYTMTYASIDITPNDEQIINSNKPTISVDWPYAFGASLKNAKVTLDGKDISNDIQKHPKGFIYIAPKDMPQGIHVINAELEYNIILTKKIRLKWFFSTDTIPPKIVLNEKNNTLASRTPALGLNVKTEPYSIIKTKFNNGKELLVNSDKKGNFRIGLKGLKKNNVLLLEAQDRAGNINKRKLSVIIDTNPPKIKRASEKRIFASAAKDNAVKAVLKDGESGIFKSKMTINDKLVQTKFDEKKNLLVYKGPFKKDGRYTVKVEAWDVAGNKTSADWSFVIDTSQIIIDQSDFSLVLYKNNKPVHKLNVAVGMARFPTPNGNWTIVRKKAMASWYNPMKAWSAGMPRVIPPGPSNPLGLRTLYLDASGIRIHGTSAYGSIGTMASHGCIRVRNPDILPFFPKVAVGTPVIIRP